MAKRRSSSVPSVVGQAAKAAIDITQASAITLSHRVPMLMTMAFWPQFDTLLEAHRMVAEKVAAAFEGSVAASAEMARLGTRAALGHADAAEMATGLLAVAVAASQPARRRVRANAKRLSR